MVAQQDGKRQSSGSRGRYCFAMMQVQEDVLERKVASTRHQVVSYHIRCGGFDVIPTAQILLAFENRKGDRDEKEGDWDGIITLGLVLAHLNMISRNRC